MAEIEFEFDKDQGGEFRPSGNVISVITGHIKKDEYDQATSLLAAADAEVGDRLISEAASGASKDYWKRLAKLFDMARDVGRAALCAEKIGDHEFAAGLFEAAYEWEAAGREFRLAGMPDKAAKMFERGLLFDKAAPMYLEAKDYLNAANSFAQCGAHYHAGHLYMKMAKWDQAVEILQRVRSGHKGFAEASELLGRFFEKTGHADQAIAHYLSSMRVKPIEKETVGMHHRLAKLLAAAGRHAEAKKAWEKVLKVNPSHEKAKEGIRAIGKDDAPPLVLAPIPGVISDDGAGGAVPLSLPGDESPVVPVAKEDVAKKPVAMTSMRNDFDLFRGLPIFRNLSLDELRAIHGIVERYSAKTGERIIEQDQDGEALYVIISGKVKVEVLAPGKPPIEVATLGIGAAIGEMSMVDEAPTSARVTVIEPVSAFKFPFERFRNYLETNGHAGFKIMRVLCRIVSIRLREANRLMSE
jgi:tetratricopeptide (TPR) repeat protein